MHDSCAAELTSREDLPSFVAQTHSTRSVHERNHCQTEGHSSVRCKTLTALGDLSDLNVMLQYIMILIIQNNSKRKNTKPFNFVEVVKNIVFLN